MEERAVRRIAGDPDRWSTFGDVRTDELIANEVTVVINGSGSAEVNAVEMLEGEINGSGDILYIGKPENVHSSVNGSGSIRKRK